MLNCGRTHTFVYPLAGEKSRIKNSHIRPESLKQILSILGHGHDFSQHKPPADSWFWGEKKSPFKMNNPKGAAVGAGNYSQYFAQIKKETKQT